MDVTANAARNARINFITTEKCKKYSLFRDVVCYNRSITFREENEHERSEHSGRNIL